jgi:hypothetical protein
MNVGAEGRVVYGEEICGETKERGSWRTRWGVRLLRSWGEYRKMYSKDNRERNEKDDGDSDDDVEDDVDDKSKTRLATSTVETR